MSTLLELQQLAAAVNLEADRVHARSAELVDEAVRSRPVQREVKARAFSIQQQSSNRKLRRIRVLHVPDSQGKIWKRFVPVHHETASTYASIEATCPSSCRFKGNGCYAQAGSMHLTMGELDRAAQGRVSLDVTLAEAHALERLWLRGVPQDGRRGPRDLRLHVGGDASCERGARALARAVVDLKERGLGSAWTFTHRWREIPRRAWGSIAVLASIEDPDELPEAVAMGYAPAFTVDRFPSKKAFAIGGGWKAIPCPYEAAGGGEERPEDAETSKAPRCVECRLCLDQDLLGRRRAIAFALHGALVDVARTRLPVLR